LVYIYIDSLFRVRLLWHKRLEARMTYDVTSFNSPADKNGTACGRFRVGLLESI